MRISDWSSDVCSSDLPKPAAFQSLPGALKAGKITQAELDDAVRPILETKIRMGLFEHPYVDVAKAAAVLADPEHLRLARVAAERSAVLLRRSEEHTSELQSLMRISYAVFCLKKKKTDHLGLIRYYVSGA